MSGSLTPFDLVFVFQGEIFLLLETAQDAYFSTWKQHEAAHAGSPPLLRVEKKLFSLVFLSESETILPCLPLF